MTDVLTPEQRRRNMANIRGRDTRPERIVRSMLHRIGYRYSLHRADLPGKPDLVFPRLHKIIFVHGCYWHMHDCKYGKVAPATNAEFWRAKRLSNVRRDKKTLAALRRAGWQVSIVWECTVRGLDPDVLRKRLVRFLGNRRLAQTLAL